MSCGNPLGKTWKKPASTGTRPSPAPGTGTTTGGEGKAIPGTGMTNGKSLLWSRGRCGPRSTGSSTCWDRERGFSSTGGCSTPFPWRGTGRCGCPTCCSCPRCCTAPRRACSGRNTQSPWPSPRGAPIWRCGRTSPGRGRRWPKRGGPTACWRRPPTAMSCGCARPFPRCWWRWRATCRNCPASPAGTRRKSAGCGRCSPLSRGTTPSLCGWRTSLPACSSAGGSACGLFKMCWASPPSNTSSSCGYARQRSFCWRRG